MKLNFKHVEYFRALMRTGTVSGAAKLMNVSQPNISRIVKHMEDRLSMPLFERRQGRLIPTREAHALFAEIEPLHQHLASLDESVRRIVAGETTRFAVGTSPSLGRYVVPRVLASLKQKLPRAQLRVDVLSMAQVLDYLSYHQGECACTIFPLDHPHIESTALAQGQLVCVMPKRHRLARQSSVTAADLASEQLVGFDLATPHGAIVQQLFAQAGVQPDFSTIVRFAETACALVEQGLGVTLVDEFTCAGPTFPELTTVPVKMRPPFRIYLHRHRDRPLSIAGREFLNLLLSWSP